MTDYGCRHRWLLRDDGDYECDSCHLILTPTEFQTAKRIGCDVQLTQKEGVLIRSLHLLDQGMRFTGSKEEIKEFLKLLADRERL